MSGHSIITFSQLSLELTSIQNMQLPLLFAVLVGLCVVIPSAADLSALFKEAHEANKKEAAAESNFQDECNPNNVKYQFDHDKSDFEQSDCNYYECTSAKKFERKSCPDGKGVSDFFKLKYKMYGKGQAYPPCTRDVPACERSLADKGITDIRIPICGLDFVFAIDISCSINPQDKEKIRKFLMSVIRRIPVRPPFSQVGIVLFSKSVYDIAQLNSYIRRGQLLNVVKDMNMKPKECGTSTWLALQYAREVSFNPQNGARKDKKKVLIVVTDGMTYPVEKKGETLEMAKANIRANITSYVVACPNMNAGGLIGHDEWNAIATGNIDDEEGVIDPNVYALDTFDQLRSIINKIVNKACLTM
ncbi:unnamed protein product [Owenia fusiformis]|uniref:Uncharacterized protein n=1 Tax=Owenia fusiformis TaxID=6347 RepID=A0A8J1XWU2_OWEFU|nr:unnamed protein product [Owenia fusiformis]